MSNMQQVKSSLNKFFSMNGDGMEPSRRMQLHIWLNARQTAIQEKFRPRKTQEEKPRCSNCRTKLMKMVDILYGTCGMCIERLNEYYKYYGNHRN